MAKENLPAVVTIKSAVNGQLEKQIVISDAQILYSYLIQRDTKYRRNFNQFYTNGARREAHYNPYGMPLGFSYLVGDEDLGILPNFNPQRSAINSLESKLSQIKVRVFFNPVAGGWKTQKTCRNAQIYMDEIVEKENLYQKGRMSLRDALTMEYGALWVDDDQRCIQRLGPWEYYYDPAEMQFDKYSRVMVHRRFYPISDLYNRGKLDDNPNVKKKYEEGRRNVNGTYWIYYDLHNGFKYEFLDAELLTVQAIDYDCPPVVTFWYEPAMKGGFSISLIDATMGIQNEINDLERRIHDAFQVTPPL